MPLGTDGRIADLAVVRADAPLRGSGSYPVGPEHVGLVVEMVSPSSRKTDSFAEPGEYAGAGIPLFWCVETGPAIVLRAFLLHDGSYVETCSVTAAGDVDVPWGRMRVDLESLDRA